MIHGAACQTERWFESRENTRAAEISPSTALNTPSVSQARKECDAIMIAPDSKTIIKARLRTGEWATWAPKLPTTELQQWALDADERGVWTLFRAQCLPLVEFPDSHLAEIRYEVEQDWKPAYWIDLGLAQVQSRSWLEWHWQRGVDPEARRPAIPRLIKERVIARDGNVCQICFGIVEPGDVHIDHIKPWSKGGQHSVANLRVTHSLCNMRKAARWNEVSD